MDFIYSNKLTHDILIKLGFGWIKHSQNTVKTGGIGFYEYFRWGAGYPEVTGYIIPVFWSGFKVFGDEDLKQ